MEKGFKNIIENFRAQPNDVQSYVIFEDLTCLLAHSLEQLLPNVTNQPIAIFVWISAEKQDKFSTRTSAISSTQTT